MPRHAVHGGTEVGAKPGHEGAPDKALVHICQAQYSNIKEMAQHDITKVAKLLVASEEALDTQPPGSPEGS